MSKSLIKASTSIFIMAFCGLFLSSCGVKGKPLPPLTAPPIGRGSPTLAQPQEEIEKTDPQKLKEKQKSPSGGSR